MKKEIRHPDQDPKFSTGAYSAGVAADGWLYISGQAAIDFTKGEFVLGSIEEETHLTMTNLRKICEAAGASLEDIVKCTVHLKSIDDFDRFNAVYASYFNGIRPARTTVQSVMAKGISVEVDAVVKLPVK